MFPGRVVSLVGVHNWAGLWARLHNLSCLVGVSGYALIGWYCWLDSVFRWDCEHGFVVGEGLRLCSVIRQGHGLYPKVWWDQGWALQSGRPLAVLHGCAKQWLGFGWKVPPAVSQS